MNSMIKTQGLKWIILISLFILLSTNISYAQEPMVANICQTGFTGIGSWFVLSVIFIVISFMIYLLVYYASNFLNMSVISVTAKNELMQVAATLLILIFVAGLVRFMCTFEPASVFPEYSRYRTCDYGECNIMDATTGYFKDLTRYNINSLISVTVISTIINNLANIKVGINLWGMGMDAQPFNFLNKLDQITEISQATLITMTVLVQVYTGLLVFSQTALLGYILPLGILMRCFPPTRGFGGALIGLTIALLFIMPLTFVINDLAIGRDLNFLGSNVIESYKSVSNELLDELSDIMSDVHTPVDFIQKLLGFKDAGGGFATFEEFSHSMFDSFVNFMTGRVKLFGFLVTAPLVGFMLFVFTWLIRLITIVIVANLILPLINLAIIATATRELSRLFGEQIDISNLTRMI